MAARGAARKFLVPRQFLVPDRRIETALVLRSGPGAIGLNAGLSNPRSYFTGRGGARYKEQGGTTPVMLGHGRVAAMVAT